MSEWFNILPRLLCATASRSEGTCSGSGVSSALRRQICTAKAPRELQRDRKRREGEDKIRLDGLHPVTRQKDMSPFACIFFYHRFCVSPFSLPPLCPPLELQEKFPDWRCWQALSTLAQAGSPWKSIAGYCWNNNHSNRSCKYLGDGKAAPLCQPKHFFKKAFLFMMSNPCSFHFNRHILLYLKCYAFFHSTTVSPGSVVWAEGVIDSKMLLKWTPGALWHSETMITNKKIEDWHKCPRYRAGTCLSSTSRKTWNEIAVINLIQKIEKKTPLSLYQQPFVCIIADERLMRVLQWPTLL